MIENLNNAEKKLLPNGWRWTKLIDLLVSLETGSRPKGGAVGIDNGIPSLSAEHMTRDGKFDFSEIKYVPESFYNQMQRGHVKINDILVVKDGATTGKVVFIDDKFPLPKAVVNEHVFLCRPNLEVVEPYYLFLWLYSNEGQNRMLETYRGAAIGGINQQFAQKTLIPTPPLKEQKSIVSIVRKQISAIEKAKAATEAQLEAAKALHMAYLREIFEGKDIKKFSKARLEDLTIRISKGESPCWQGFEYQKEGVLFIRSENVLWGVFSKETRTFIPREFHIKLLRSQLKARDVLVNLVGASIGRACVVPDDLGEANINQAVAVLTPKDSLDPYFLVEFFISYKIQKYFKKVQVEMARPNISLQNLRDLEIPIPSLNKQKEIVQSLNERKKKILDLEEILVGQFSNIETLSNSILRKAFNGEL